MRANQIVVIGTSAGGIETLQVLVSGLPEDFPAPVCVVMHTAPQSPAVLDSILARAGKLPAVNARNGQRLEHGRIYVAPPDFHLLVEPGTVRVTKGPRENRFRPAIDPLFRTAAQVYGPNVIGVILTGNLDDGTAGLWAIKQLGGTAVVQDPADALFPEMPTNAITQVRVDHVVPISEMAPLLVRLTSEPVEDRKAVAVPREMEVEVKVAKGENPIDAGLHEIGEPSSFACPDCHGVLLQLKEGERLRFRCHTGHAYSVASLIAAISEGIEVALWNAIRALEEGGLLMHRMADHLKTHNAAEAQRLIERGDEARRQSTRLRELASNREPLPTAAEP